MPAKVARGISKIKEGKEERGQTRILAVENSSSTLLLALLLITQDKNLVVKMRN